MIEQFIFGMHWKHDGKMYYDEVPADSKEEAVEYFIDHKRDDVSLVRVELVGPNEGGVREFVVSPNSPFSPLIARRRMDIDEDANLAGVGAGCTPEIIEMMQVVPSPSSCSARGALGCVDRLCQLSFSIYFAYRFI